MLRKIFSWVKTHKLLSFNLLVVAFILFSLLKNAVISGLSYSSDYDKGGISSYNSTGVAPLASPMADRGFSPNLSIGGMTREEYEDTSIVQSVDEYSNDGRKVVTNSSLSLLVKDVDITVENVRQKVIGMGGFVVNTNIRRDAEASSSTIEVRVPSDQLVDFSKYLRTLSVKVVYENITGTDITDQYTDYEERLNSLEGIKERLQEIMDEAETVDEIMNVQNRIFSIQSQIDSIKGQLTYMDRSTATSKVTISISTDELSLPYTPVKSWRPDVVIKNAVRSLISTFRAVATIAIWVLVFLPLILFVVAVKISIKYLFRNRKRKENIKDLK